MRTKLKSIFIVGLLLISPLTASGVATRFMSKSVSYSDYYAKQRELLTQDEINTLLDRGRQLESQTTLTQTLSTGGSALFPIRRSALAATILQPLPTRAWPPVKKQVKIKSCS